MKKNDLRLLMTRSLMLFICLLSLANAAMAADTTAYNLHTYLYKKVGIQELQLDVYAPAIAAKPNPVIILFHGGSWVSGDKAQLQNQCKYFVQQGLVAVTANYRLLGQDTGHKDLCIMDARSAIRWVKSHAMLLHLDTANIILGGASAGGHLATMALLNQSLNDAADDRAVSISARALVLFNPAYSVTEDPTVEPFRYVKAGLPPVIMFFGSRDKWKPAADSVRTLLLQAGVHCETWIANGETHGFFNKNPWMLATCIKAQSFLSSLGLTPSTLASAPAILTADPSEGK